MIKKSILIILLIAAFIMSLYLMIDGFAPKSPAQQVRMRGYDRYVAIEESQFERLIQALEKIADNQQPPK